MHFEAQCPTDLPTDKKHKKTADKMTKEEADRLKVFETRVRQLILHCNKLQERNVELEKLVAAKDEELKKADEIQKESAENYSRLKMAKMMEIGNEDITEAKARINKLVRQIDKCIALLGV